jgi:hypothetical protein
MARLSNLSIPGATPDNPIELNDNIIHDDVPSKPRLQHVSYPNAPNAADLHRPVCTCSHASNLVSTVIEGEVLLGEWRHSTTSPPPIVVGKVVRGRAMFWCVLPRDVHGDEIPRFAARACHHTDVFYLPAFRGKSLVGVTLRVWKELERCSRRCAIHS